jgi:hypothetical protein
MTTDERFLQTVLRVVGTAGLLAIPFVLMPHSWLDAIHQGLGMGELSTDPVTGYLARSTSALHAVIGGLLWTVSLDLQRHRLVLGWLGVAFVLYGLAMLARLCKLRKPASRNPCAGKALRHGTCIP